MKFFKMFQNFNLLLKYCNEKIINLSELNLSDIYLTEKNELKLLSINYNSEIIRENKNQKFNDNNNSFIIKKNKIIILKQVKFILLDLYYIISIIINIQKKKKLISQNIKFYQI